MTPESAYSFDFPRVFKHCLPACQLSTTGIVSCDTTLLMLYNAQWISSHPGNSHVLI